MQPASQAWIESNSRAFTTPSSIGLAIEMPDGRYAMVGNSNIISFRHESSGDILSGTLSMTKITATLDNRSGIFGDGRTNSEKYNNCKLTATYGFKRKVGNIYDSIRGGVYYVNGYDVDENNHTVTITAVDILSLMTNPLESSTDEEQSAMVWVELIKRQCNESNIVPVADLQIEYDDEFFREVDFVFPQSGKTTCREALQLIANGCMCVLYTDRNNTIHIEPLNRKINVDYVISENVQYSRPKISYDNPINGMIFYINDKRAIRFPDPDLNGQNQIAENRALHSDFIDIYPGEVLSYMYSTFEETRVSFSGTWRADPRLDLFDVISVESCGELEQVCVTSFTYTFSGAWKGTFKAKTINATGYYTNIASLEQYRIIELEASKIKELEGAR